MKIEKLQGIYKIENKTNGKVYIGSSKDINKRWKQHIRMLNNNEHHSSKLQRSWNKTANKDIFKFEVVEIIDDSSKLLDVEHYYIFDVYNSFEKGYNCSDPLSPRNNASSVKTNKAKIAFEEMMNLYNRLSERVFFDKSYAEKLMNTKCKNATMYKNITKIIQYFETSYDSNGVLNISKLKNSIRFEVSVGSIDRHYLLEKGNINYYFTYDTIKKEIIDGSMY